MCILLNDSDFFVAAAAVVVIIIIIMKLLCTHQESNTFPYEFVSIQME